MTIDRITLGPVELLLADGDLRYLRVGGVEVLRRIYVSVRDASWGTIPPRITDRRLERRADGFALTCDARHAAGDVDFAWRGSIAGHVSGSSGDAIDATFTFSFAGGARSDFRTNRTGLCVLHPVRPCAGLPCRITRPDGASADAAFPELISPHQVFLDVRAMACEPAPGLRVELSFDGEVFETEDQRNWTDGSYKTYCRPLSRGFPYQLRAGERVEQSVTVRIRGTPPAPSAPPAEPALVLGEPCGDLPPLALVRSPLRPPTADESALLAALGLPSAEPPADLPGFFVDLNRNRPPADATGTLAWPIDPQAHSTDDLSLVENLQGIADTVRTARSFAPRARLAVGPVMLQRRRPASTTGEASATAGDPRHRSPLAAAWTVVALKHLAEAGADAITVCETVGPFGLMDGGQVFPLYEALRSLAAFAGARVLGCRSTDPLAFDALALQRDGHVRLIVASFLDRPLEVTLAPAASIGPRRLALPPGGVRAFDVAS